MRSTRTLMRACALPTAAAAVVLTGGVASAHVGISPSETTAGSYAILTASVPHGCEGSPTTKVAIQMPEEILAVTPTRNALWEVEKVMKQLAEPVTDAHGNEITERVDQVVYTADNPLPEGYRDAFELSLQIPDVPGETLVFPVIQTCKQGETAWVETAPDGNTEELEAPAPTVTVLPAEEAEAAGDTSDTAADSDTAGEGTTDQVETVAATESDGNALGIAGLVAGLLGLAAGVAALVRVRRR